MDKKFQGKGYGRIYLNYIINTFLLNIKETKYISLECEDRLIGFYQKFGFEKVNINYYYHGTKLNLMILSKNNCNNKLFQIKIGNYLLKKFNSNDKRNVALDNITPDGYNILNWQMKNIPKTFSYIFLLLFINKLRFHIFDTFRAR